LEIFNLVNVATLIREQIMINVGAYGPSVIGTDIYYITLLHCFEFLL